MKFLTWFLAFVLLIYSIVTFLHEDPTTKKISTSLENSIKGVIYLGWTLLVVAYLVSN
jgi:hypothetical protein